MFWKHCSRHKNPILGSDVSAQISNYAKYLETLRKHQLNMSWGF